MMLILTKIKNIYLEQKGIKVTVASPKAHTKKVMHNTVASPKAGGQLKSANKKFEDIDALALTDATFSQVHAMHSSSSSLLLLL